jgi:hypothetical protein
VGGIVVGQDIWIDRPYSLQCAPLRHFGWVIEAQLSAEEVVRRSSAKAAWDVLTLRRRNIEQA